MKVNELQRDRGNPSLYNRVFRTVFEKHLKENREIFIAKTEPVTPQMLVKYRGDFYGMLVTLNVKEDMHWFTMRLNELHSPADYNQNNPFVLIINAGAVKRILDQYLTTQQQL